MSEFMTDEQIEAEQALIREQQTILAQRYDESMPAQLTSEQADSVNPFDLLSSDNYTTKQERDRRYAICKGCEHLFKPTASCKECGCFMALKTWLKDATCALHDDPKW